MHSLQRAGRSLSPRQRLALQFAFAALRALSQSPFLAGLLCDVAQRVSQRAPKSAEQDARLTKQEAFIAQQQKQIEALTADLQKVNTRLQMSRPAPQVAENNH
jgi:uncharacterized coiled-coil protein SlyX